MDIQWEFWKCLLTLLSLTLIQGSTINLVAPSIYYVFSGDIRVDYELPADKSYPNGIVKLLDNNTEIITLSLQQGQQKSAVIVLCGVVDYAGKFVFRLYEYHGGPLLKESNIMDAQWPDFDYALPKRPVLTNTEDVNLVLKKSGAGCNSRQQSSKFWIEVLYYGFNTTTTEHGKMVKRTTVIYDQNITKLTELPTNLYVSCYFIDQAGSYQGFLLMSSKKRERTVISASNIMTVHWSREYALEIHHKKVFPCTDNILVSYKYPKCVGSNDKIRLYAQKRLATGSIAAPMSSTYADEERVTAVRSSVAFSCASFHMSNLRYCFKYISTARSGAVKEQVTKCIPTTDAAALVIHGEWSDWSSWNSCIGPCKLGKQSRSRTCDNPPPSLGGTFCDGKTVEWQDCVRDCEDPGRTTSISTTKITLPPCACGCSMADAGGKIDATYPCGERAQWLITVKAGKSVDLVFEEVNLKENVQWIKVRDGDDSERSELLVHLTGNTLPPDVISSRNVLLVELLKTDTVLTTRGQGFKARYKTVDPVVASGGLSEVKNEEDENIWSSTVTIVGITLCVIIIFGAALFVLHHRVWKRRRGRYKYQLAKTGENGCIPGSQRRNQSAHAMLMKGTFSDDLNQQTGEVYGMVVSSTDNSGSMQAAENTYVKLSSPTRTKKESVGATANLKLISSKEQSLNTSHNSLLIEGIDMGAGPSGLQPHKGAPRPQTLPDRIPRSPYAINAKPNDYVHDANLFRAKPISSPEKDHSSHPQRHHHHHHRRHSDDDDRRHHHRHHRSHDNRHHRHEHDDRRHERRKDHNKSPGIHKSRSYPNQPDSGKGRRSPVKSPTKDVVRECTSSPTRPASAPYNPRGMPIHSAMSPGDNRKVLPTPPPGKHGGRTSTPKPHAEGRNTPRVHGEDSKREGKGKGVGKSSVAIDLFPDKQKTGVRTIHENIPLQDQPEKQKKRVKSPVKEVAASPNPNVWQLRRPLSDIPETSYLKDSSQPSVAMRPRTPHRDSAITPVDDKQKSLKRYSSSSKESKGSDKKKNKTKTKDISPLATSPPSRHVTPEGGEVPLGPFYAQYPPQSNAQKSPTSPLGTKPDAKKLTLPVRPITKPDGQSPHEIILEVPHKTIPSSPEKHICRSSSNSPAKLSKSPTSSGTSKSPKRLPTVPNTPTRSCKTPSEYMSTDGFEYDDYIPDDPGSYFNMDETYNFKLPRSPKSRSGSNSPEKTHENTNTEQV